MGRFIFVSLGLLVVAFSLTGARHCPSDQLSMQTFCYKVFDHHKNWNDAEMYCTNYRPDCHLASIHSVEESTALAGYVSRNLRSGGNVWIGFHDPSQRGQWTWADRSATNHAAWARNEPDRSEDDEFCAQLQQGSGYFHWRVSNCEKLKPFLCKCP
ncbi:C-type lectin lectoxin-Thr1-like [Erythrolamprus reginae]|uniref:C-type lectin lectoxin-Thr1-like n=1 Tax=Erythrolamprus reginae TaxID=121349 RepID=UPI00396C6DBD